MERIMRKVMFLLVTTLVVVAFASCGNKSANSNAVADSDSVITDTVSVDSVSSQTTQQMAQDSAAVNSTAAASASQK